MKSKRNYKDSLFVHMFGKNVNAKEYFLSLYNALHGTNLKIGEVTIKPVTLSNTVYTGLENDVAMQIDDAIVVLIEQQSTINENMPFRCLEYVTALYSAMFKNEEKYKKKRLKFPRPEFYVFYNGKEPYPAQKVMKLSDSFSTENHKNLPEEIQLELSVKVITLNSEENISFLKSSQAATDGSFRESKSCENSEAVGDRNSRPDRMSVNLTQSSSSMLYFIKSLASKTTLRKRLSDVRRKVFCRIISRSLRRRSRQ